MPDQPTITDTAREAAIVAGHRAHASWKRSPDGFDQAFFAATAIEGALAAAPHIAAQACTRVARDLLDIADDEAQRPSRDCCSHAIETAYREAARQAAGLNSEDLADNPAGRPGSAAPSPH